MKQVQLKDKVNDMLDEIVAQEKKDKPAGYTNKTTVVANLIAREHKRICKGKG